MMASDVQDGVNLAPDCRTILNSVADVIVLVTADSRIIACNRAAEGFFGLSRDALTGTSLFDWCGPQQHDGRSNEDFVHATLDAARAGVVQTEWCYSARGITAIAEISIGLADHHCEVPLMVVSIRDASARKRVESRLRYQTRVLKMLVQGEALEHVLNTLTLEVENDNPAMRCMLLQVSEDRSSLHVLAAPSLPMDVVAMIDESGIGPDAIGIGAAAWAGERIIVKDLELQPFPHAHIGPLRAAGLNACWSEPIRSAQGSLIGMFGVFLSEPRFPSTSEVESITQAADLASIAIEQTLARRRACVRVNAASVRW